MYISIITCLCFHVSSAGHLPPGFSLSTLLPLLSLLLHLLELHLMPAHTESSRHTPYTNTSPDSPLDPLKLLSSVLTTLENMHKLVHVSYRLHNIVHYYYVPCVEMFIGKIQMYDSCAGIYMYIIQCTYTMFICKCTCTCACMMYIH